jgi:hypothetical protein
MTPQQEQLSYEGFEKRNPYNYRSHRRLLARVKCGENVRCRMAIGAGIGASVGKSLKKKLHLETKQD